MTQNALQVKKSRSFAEQSIFVSSIPSSMYVYGGNVTTQIVFGSVVGYGAARAIPYG